MEERFTFTEEEWKQIASQRYPYNKIGETNKAKYRQSVNNKLWDTSEFLDSNQIFMQLATSAEYISYVEQASSLTTGQIKNRLGLEYIGKYVVPEVCARLISREQRKPLEDVRSMLFKFDPISSKRTKSGDE